MKKFKIQYLLFFFLVSACEIDRLPENTVSDESFWKSENDLRAAANYLYTFLPTMPTTSDNWSDDGFAMVANDISSGTRLPPATAADYSSPYLVIRAANNIIEKSALALSAGVVPATVDIYVAEARFFRAWAYLQLLQKYGDVPLVLTTLSEDSEELTSPATPRAQIIDAIYSDLDASSSKLPTATQRGSTTNYGRITKTAALALKARAALFEGTRAKFHKYGEPAKHLNLAAKAAKDVIDSKEHSLLSDYFNLFQYAGEGRQNPENILVRQYGNSMTDQILSHNIGLIINGSSNPTKVLIDSYLMKDGLPISKSPLYTTPKSHTEIFANRDPRLSATVMKQGDQYFQNTGYTFPQLVYHTTGFCFRKFINAADQLAPNNNQSFIDLPIIRYAEVLATYAEAVYELNENISDADLDLSLNLIRARAGIPSLTNSFVAANGLNMREEIRRERRVEFTMEGLRYWDIIRWKTAEIELPKPVLGCYYFPDGFGTQKPIVDDNNFILVQTASTRRFDPAKDYLWPIPINELALNPKLVQNPGWK